MALVRRGLVARCMALTRTFLAVPATLLAVVGTAVAVVVAFKNQQCFARVNEALHESWGQITATSQMWAIKLVCHGRPIANRADGDGGAEACSSHRHLAWLTALRFLLRERKVWENTLRSGECRYMARLPTPESQSTLDKELAAYLPPDELSPR